MATSPDFRKSDRWITPGVIITFLIIGGQLVAVVLASVAYLAARGVDPGPLVNLVPILVTAATSLGGFVLTLAGRSTAAKTERNTGTLPGVITEAVTGAVTAALPPAPPTPDPVTGYAGSSLPPVPTGYAR